jgi:hypothetical protein
MSHLLRTDQDTTDQYSKNIVSDIDEESFLLFLFIIVLLTIVVIAVCNHYGKKKTVKAVLVNNLDPNVLIFSIDGRPLLNLEEPASS